jgi:hypothetical protein
VQYFVFTGTATNRATFRELIHIITTNSNTWASLGWGGTIGTALGDPLAVSLRLINVLTDAPPTASTMDSLISLANKTTHFAKPARVVMNESTSYYGAYRGTYGSGDGLLGVGVAISSRLVPRTSLETPAQQNEMTDALAKVSEILSPDTSFRNPIGSVYHYPLEMLLVTPYNFKPSTDPLDAVSVTPAWRNATWHIVIKDGMANDVNASSILSSYRKVYEAAGLFRKLTPDSGAYQNEADLFEPRYEQSFWGAANYARLSSLKRKIDPQNLLTCWQCIGYQKKDSRYSCYPEFRP